ncbi:MAG TPA: T9SS type A sorting domain-containing protein [Prolixibacteraceae bacterium]|nr:T9SS type A sorting domain-containing protein [Prolixibacteraceae bacterium]
METDFYKNQLYWGESNKVKKSKTNGSDLQTLFTAASGYIGALALDLTNNKLYFSNFNNSNVIIRRCNLDGTDLETIVTSPYGGNTYTLSISITLQKLYWTQQSGSNNYVMRCNMDGSNVETLMTVSNFMPGLTIDENNQKLYLAYYYDNKVMMTDMTCSTAPTLVFGSSKGTFQMAVNNVENKLYFAEINSRKIRKCNLDGSSPEDIISLISGNIMALSIPTVPLAPTISANETYTFSLNDFLFSSVDKNLLTKVQITIPVGKGTLYLDANYNNIVDEGEAIALNQEISKENIVAGILKFNPAANESGLPYTTFSFKWYNGATYSVIEYLQYIYVLDVAPTITTQAVTDISSITATGHGNITFLGVPGPTAYGICWNTTGAPTIDNSKVDKGAASATGAFTASMSGLSANTTYHVRAFATNTTGTTYGEEQDFTTLLLPPTVSSVTVPSNGTYTGGDHLDFTVNFSEAVTVNTTGGTPSIPVTLNVGGTVNASYVSGSGTSALVFRYTVSAGNLDNDGISVGSTISANGGTLKDATSIDANLTLNSIASTTAVLVDAVAPTVSSVSATTANGTYQLNDVISITVTFSEAVTVTGTPALTLNSGGSASYASGSGTTVLTFNYTVGNGQSSADLEYSSTSALSLAGGTIQDAAGNHATLTLPAVGGASSLGGQKNIVIGVLPTITTQAVSAITATGATGNGNITALGYPLPTAYGVCWSTTANPTTANSHTNEGAASSTGAFTSSITGLAETTTYHVRAYATNATGTSYGEDQSFTTPASCTNPTSGGTIATEQTICTGNAPEALTSTALPSGQTGVLEYKWQSSTTSSTSGFSDISSANSTTYAPGVLHATTWYKRLARVTCMSDWTGAAASNVIRITVDAQPTANAGLDQTLCNTSTFTMAAVPTVGTGMWSFVGEHGSAVITTAGSATTTITSVPFDQNITLRWTEVNGKCSSFDEVVIRNDAQPVANAGADQAICLGASTRIGADKVEGNTYRWTSMPEGFTSTEANPTVAPLVNTTYTLVETNAAGCTSSSTVKVTVNPLPEKAGDIAGAVIVNPGQRIIYSVPAIANATSYIWTLPDGATGTSNTESISVKFESAFVAGNITVKGKNDCGEGLSSTLAVSLNKAPVANAGKAQRVDEGNLVTLDGSLSSDSDLDNLTYLWVAPAEILLSSLTDPKPTFTAPEVKADTCFTFSLIVNDGTLNSTSSSVSITVTNLIKTTAEIPLVNPLKAYPNPTRGIITIEGMIPQENNSIALYTIDGRWLFDKTTRLETDQVDLSGLAPGTYLLRVNKQIIKIKRE